MVGSLRIDIDRPDNGIDGLLTRPQYATVEDVAEALPHIPTATGITVIAEGSATVGDVVELRDTLQRITTLPVTVELQAGPPPLMLFHVTIRDASNTWVESYDVAAPSLVALREHLRAPSSNLPDDWSADISGGRVVARDYMDSYQATNVRLACER